MKPKAKVLLLVALAASVVVIVFGLSVSYSSRLNALEPHLQLVGPRRARGHGVATRQHHRRVPVERRSGRHANRASRVRGIGMLRGCVAARNDVPLHRVGRLRSVVRRLASSTNDALRVDQ